MGESRFVMGFSSRFNRVDGLTALSVVPDSKGRFRLLANRSNVNSPAISGRGM